MKIIRLLGISFFLIQVSYGQTWQDTLTLIGKTMNQYHPENPGCQLSISRNGQLIFSKAWGMADVEQAVPLSNRSIFEAGSVSKQFTAGAILLLEQQGKLMLDDDVRKYIPELPDYGIKITLRQMLHHTSGLRDWGDIAALTGWPRGKKMYTNDDVLEMIIQQKHLNNRPGAEFLYSNSNYNLLAIIVQRVSDLSLAAFTRKYIFEPAGMELTQWRDDPNRIVPNRAIAYTKVDSSFEMDMPNEYVYGQGGLLTTTEDLLKWNNFYQTGRLGIPSLLAKQIKVEPFNNGTMNTYAAGLFIHEVRGWNNISHSGATASYRAYLETFPELNLSFAILSNTSQFNINDLARSISAIFVPGKSGKSFKENKSINLSEAQLNKVVGLYKNQRDGSTFQLSTKNNKIILDNDLLLVTAADNIFKSDNFQLNVTGSRGWYIPYFPRDTIPFIKVIPAKSSSKDMTMYEGKYFSQEVNTIITIQHDKGKLIMQLKPGVTYRLEPTYMNAFWIRELDGNMEFMKSPHNEIIGMSMNLTRARNITFRKIK